ncbi:uncharacterized protein L969DRAFT_299364 [Mixia osmundae IAM 14324]|uniref:Uncharacterized protein n=1 Tax=Mixia osmundae (strain CBS 9802 / IAM 14324 / JCM 22182 / KY 12970) TaxID=764103 RepID=G7DXY2_MIXOS|nr:uncharacterized protein L969DRAFT_299364 [Mixia osmundae IAM 14324]KEI41345.1 hypothetical protein L969DRAFT_299364 [Mixia osmundae IAM 14324]GAA95442.1 hypothetical protein E5Q_02096 [Mixia osmundae IAM 14324]
MSWIWADVKSLLPLQEHEVVRGFPTAGNAAPQTDDLRSTSSNSRIIAFQRHLGCPFCEKTVRQMIRAAPKKEKVEFIIVSHATQQESDEWLTDLLHRMPHERPSNVRIVADPERRLYAKWGVGQLGWAALFNMDTLSKVSQLAKEGIKNTYTHGNRWQNHGTFAVDPKGTITWSHLGKDAGDMSDIGAAIASLS